MLTSPDRTVPEVGTPTHLGHSPLQVCSTCRMVVPAPVAHKKAKSRKPAPVPTLGSAKKPTVDSVEVEDWEPVTVRVNGVPVTQGSMKIVRGRRLVHTKAKELGEWRELIAKEFQAAGAKPVGKHTPVRLDVVFWLPRPASVSADKRPLPSAKSADLDKAIRAVGDAIDSIIIEDDSQITTVVAQKRYADEANPPGAWIRVTLDDTLVQAVS